MDLKSNKNTNQLQPEVTKNRHDVQIQKVFWAHFKVSRGLSHSLVICVSLSCLPSTQSSGTLRVPIHTFTHTQDELPFTFFQMIEKWILTPVCVFTPRNDTVSERLGQRDSW